MLKTSPQVKGYQYRGKQQAYDALKKVYQSQNATDREIFSSVQVKDMNESYRVTLNDPQKFDGVKSAVGGLDGVNTVQDLHTLLEPIYFWLGWMQKGRDRDRRRAPAGGGPRGGQHDPAGGVRAPARDRDHAPGGRRAASTSSCRS